MTKIKLVFRFRLWIERLSFLHFVLVLCNMYTILLRISVSVARKLFLKSSIFKNMIGPSLLKKLQHGLLDFQQQKKYISWPIWALIYYWRYIYLPENYLLTPQFFKHVLQPYQCLTVEFVIHMPSWALPRFLNVCLMSWVWAKFIANWRSGEWRHFVFFALLPVQWWQLNLLLSQRL